ncbi:contact-dependent growth inhibition system immunity protein [Kitasatospora sp. NPDC004240]
MALGVANAAWDDRPVTRSADRDRSLDELEGDRWPAPLADAPPLVVRAHALRHRPVGELTIEDLRLLIGQNVGLAHLLPLAVEVLRDDPMAEGDLYEGDLLSAVLTRSADAWRDHPALQRELMLIVASLSDLLPGLAQQAERFPGLLATG